MEPLIAYFESQGLTTAEARKVAAVFILKDLEKGDYFVEEGKISKQLGFIESGFLQYYLLTEGEERTTYAATSGYFVASLISFLKEEPARENIRAVAPTRLWVIEKKKMEELLASLPAFKNLYMGILEWQICCIDESRLDSITLTAQKRYEKMMEKEPVLIQQIPLQYLASILGVTPRHLSRIRKNIR
jgi:CRP/FNR family transcriptional regulator, anaerobic regulatory protein